MKKIALIILAVVSMAMVSCGGGSKEITPKETQFTHGDLSKLIEVVDEPVQLTLEKSKKGEGQIFKIKLKLKLVKSKYANVKDPRDISFYGVFIALIDILDENDDKLVDGLDVKDSQQLRKFLTKEEGTVEEFVFEKEVHAGKESKKWYKEAVSFKPGSTCSLHDF